MINPLNLHYSFNTPASVHDEEAMTTLELAGRQGAKINEIIADQNKLHEETTKSLTDIKNVVVPNAVKNEVNKNIENGAFTESINAYTRDLEGRVDNLSKMSEGSTTGDAELTDARVDYNGTPWGNVGNHIRKTTKKLNDEISQMVTEELENVELTLLGGWFDYSTKTWSYENHYHVKENVSTGDCYRVSTTYGWFMSAVVFFNANNEYVSHVLSNESGYKTEKFETPIFVPSGASYMVVQVFEEKLTDLKLQKVINRRPTFDSVYMNNMVESVTPKNPSLEEIYGVLHTRSVIANGIKTSDEEGFLEWHVCEFDVERGQRYRIKGTNAYYNSYYEIYDNVGHMIEHEIIENQKTPLTFEREIVIPNTGAKLYVIGHNLHQHATALKYVGSNSNINSLSHLKWACLGDSLTEVNSRTSKHYFDYVKDKTGVNVVNMGVSGSGYKRLEENNNAFYQRALSIPTDVDVVTIFGSGNDLSLTLGTPTDTGTSTICGCVNKTIENILSVNPTVQIGIVSPTPWQGNTPKDNGTMKAYAEALEQIAKNHSLPFLDLFHCSGLRPNDSAFRNLAFSKDDGNGVHPDETGHKMISSQFYVFLQSLVGVF